MKFLKVTLFLMMIAGLGVYGCGGGNATTEDAGGDGGVNPGQDTGPGGDTGVCAKENETCSADVPCCDGQGNCTGGKCIKCVATAGDCEVDGDCCKPGDAAKGAWCNEEGKCAECAQKDGTCATDYDCCPPADANSPSLMCASKGTCEPICSTDSDCAKGTCGGKDEVCMPNGECLCPSCSADSDCNGKKCCSGKCEDDCGYGTPDHCAIVTPGGVIFKDKSLQLTAVAYKGDPKAGGIVIPWTTFTWSTTDATKVDVDQTGLITGKTAFGDADIGAKAGTVDCGKVTFSNYLPEDASKVRVLVYDEKTGAPVKGATVLVGTDNLGTTNVAGMVEKTTTPGDVHVFHKDYAYVSVIGTTKNDLVIHLTPKVDDAKSGGFKGGFDFTNVKDNAIQLGLAGNSIAGNLLDLDFNVLIGEMILTHIKLSTKDGAPTDYDDWIGLPGALVLKAQQFGAPDLIPNYRVLGEAGLRTAWGIGGGLPSKDITKLIQILSPIIGGGGSIPIGQIVAAVLPLFNKFSHAVTSAFEVDPIAKVATPCIDTKTGLATADAYPCDNPANTNLKPLVDAETMADYDHFPTLALKLMTKMALKTTFTLPDLPKAIGLDGKAHYMGGLAALGGVYLPDMGMVPLGISAGLDNPDDPKTEGDGKVNKPSDNPDNLTDGQLQLRMSPNHDGTETAQYVFAFLALDFNQLGGSGSSNAISGRVMFSDKLDPTYDMTSKPFLAFADGSVYDTATRKIVGPTAKVEGAAFYRYKVNNDKGDWYVYAEKNDTAITLPAAPTGVDDRADKAAMSAHAISLTGTTTLDTLISADSGQHLNNLFDVVDAFSHISCQQKILQSDPNYPTKCTPTDPTKVDPACNPACEYK